MTKKKKEIDGGSSVTAHVYGDTVELSTALGGTPVMRKINKDEMVNIHTGKIVKIHHVESRADPKNYQSLRSTFKRLKRLIGANFHGGKSELWLTLTYRESPMTNSKRLYADFNRFRRRLKKIIGKEFAYIIVVEPQASGSLHAHILLKTLDRSHLYIENAVIAKAWDQGFVNVRRLSNADNTGAYLMAYLSDVDLNNLEGNFDSKNDKDQPKKIVKGGRLGLYPVGMQIYRRSRKGLVEPTKIKASKEEIQDKYGLKGLKPDYYRSFEVVRTQDKDEPYTIETEYFSIKKARMKQALNKINQN